MIYEGMVVMLKPGVTNLCPAGRDDNVIAEVQATLDNGGLFLKEDLHGCRYWNVEDVVVVNADWIK